MSGPSWCNLPFAVWFVSALLVRIVWCARFRNPGSFGSKAGTSVFGTLLRVLVGVCG